MSVLNKDTLFLCDPDGLTGGIFRSTNGGSNFVNINSWRANNIYMYNSTIGFISSSYGLSKTTNGGFNWTLIYNKGFVDIKFVDSLTGYKVFADSLNGGIQKTTDGGYNWIIQRIPNVPDVFTFRSIGKICFVGNDTIYAVGSAVQYVNPLRSRGLIYKTTNSGLNWGYQLPDTHNIQVSRYDLVCFWGNKNGWIYDGHYLPGKGMGIHTITGGDSTIYATIKNEITSISYDYVLFQNYPNPFNATSNIKYKLEKTTKIKLVVFDIRGKEITTLVNKKQNAGEYKVSFNGANLPSGVYYYALYADGVKMDAKKMVLLK